MSGILGMSKGVICQINMLSEPDSSRRVEQQGATPESGDGSLFWSASAGQVSSLSLSYGQSGALNQSRSYSFRVEVGGVLDTLLSVLQERKEQAEYKQNVRPCRML